MVTFGETAVASPTISFDKVQLPNGVRLHFAQQGPRTGPALVLLHGYSDSWASFGRVLPLFRPDLRVLVPDLRGHGDSSRPPLAKNHTGQISDGETETGQPATGYRIADFAEDVIQLMNGLRIPTAVVLGHSMGGFVARRIAAFVEERVSRLILVGSGPEPKTPAIRDLKREVDVLSDPVDPEFVRAFRESTVFQPVPAYAAIANSRRMPAFIWKAALDGLLADVPPAEKLFCRTLVLGGRQDQIFPPTEQMALARQFPRGELELVDGVGHALHWENPARFMSALSRFGV